MTTRVHYEVDVAAWQSMPTGSRNRLQGQFMTPRLAALEAARWRVKDPRFAPRVIEVKTIEKVVP